MKTFLALLLIAASRVLAQTEPTYRDISYGPHERHKLDVWMAKSDQPTPLLIFIHGGGWHGGEKTEVLPKVLAFMVDRGYSPATIQGVTKVFDLAQPERGWAKRAPIPGSPRGWCASAVVGEKFYVLGGVTWTAKARVRLAETLSYDPARDEWKRLADFPMLISGWEGEVFADRYIIAVGGAGTRWNDVPFVYDRQTDRWMRIASPLPPGALFNDPGVCIIGDTIYVAGGEGSGRSHFNHFLIGRIKPRLSSNDQ